ncbi:MAG TPA: glycosyltransferase family 2 protein [Bryobacteraceae bacterium]|nr:glycosyltransferase family 2 protein [Bryobacteraceae bacterium]
MADRVAVVVVTYNRKALLVECLEALLRQTLAPERILVIDNAATDGTPELLAQTGLLNEPSIWYQRLDENLGGAGGFEIGMRLAYSHLDCDWFWLMDDDTIPTPTALEELLAASRSLASWSPSVLASRVEYWAEPNGLCNLPRFRVNSPWGANEPPERLMAAAATGSLPIRNVTFVAPMISRAAVERHGFPVGGYFIYADDIEYTGRILKNEFGAMVLASVVRHKTNPALLPHETPPPRFFYHIRNTIWMIRVSGAYSRSESFVFVMHTAAITMQFLLAHRFSWRSVKAIASAVFQGLFRRPPSIASKVPAASPTAGIPNAETISSKVSSVRRTAG